MSEILRYSGAVRRDPGIEAWFSRADPLRDMVRPWFELVRKCGTDVRELMHDGCPVACVSDAPFAYVNAFKGHANVGFYHGASLADPAGILHGEGKRMRHVKLRPGEPQPEGALKALIALAYEDIRQRLKHPTERAIMPAAAKISARKVVAMPAQAGSPAKLVEARIDALGDWRGEVLGRVRALIREACPGAVEDVKWRKPSNGMLGVPVWEHAGILCTGETYKAVVKLTFAKGAALADPKGLFNSSLEGNVRRAIDIREGERLDASAFKALIRAAAAHNAAGRRGAGNASAAKVRTKAAAKKGGR
jgi:hypothetical protein